MRDSLEARLEPPGFVHPRSTAAHEVTVDRSKRSEKHRDASRSLERQRKPVIRLKKPGEQSPQAKLPRTESPPPQSASTNNRNFLEKYYSRELGIRNRTPSRQTVARSGGREAGSEQHSEKPSSPGVPRRAPSTAGSNAHTDHGTGLGHIYQNLSSGFSSRANFHGEDQRTQTAFGPWRVLPQQTSQPIVAFNLNGCQPPPVRSLGGVLSNSVGSLRPPRVGAAHSAPKHTRSVSAVTFQNTIIKQGTTTSGTASAA